MDTQEAVGSDIMVSGADGFVLAIIYFFFALIFMMKGGSTYRKKGKSFLKGAMTGLITSLALFGVLFLILASVK